MNVNVLINFWFLLLLKYSCAVVVFVRGNSHVTDNAVDL
jgi:hypothetical protein